MVKKTKTKKKSMLRKVIRIPPRAAEDIRTRQNEINLKVDAVRGILTALQELLMVPTGWEYIMRDGMFRPPPAPPPNVPPGATDNGTPAQSNTATVTIGNIRPKLKFVHSHPIPLLHFFSLTEGFF